MPIPVLIPALVVGGAAYTVWRRKRHKTNNKNLKKNLIKSIGRKSVQIKSANISPEEEKSRRQQHIAFGALGIAALGSVIYPVISLGAIPLIAYNYVSLMKEVREAYRNKNNLMVTAFDAASVTLAILMSSLSIMAFFMVVVYTTRRLIALTERQVQADFGRIFGELSTTAWLLKDQVEIEVPLKNLLVNDIIVVHAGEMIPVDGAIVSGEGMLDQHLLTGEFQPVEKKVGDSVFTSTLLISGTLQIQVEKQGAETITGQIAKTLEHASTLKQQVQSRGDQIVEKGVSRTLLVCGAATPFIALNHLVALSFSGFGYQMRAAAPLMVFNYLRLASHNGVLIKDGRALDKFHNIDTIVFDKTGTLTEETPHISQLMACEGFTENQLLQYAASAEQRQKHPIGLAICSHAKQESIDLLELHQTDYLIGHGLRAELIEPAQQQLKTVVIGSRRFIDNAGIMVPQPIERMQEAAGNQGHSVVYVASEDGILMGALELSPVVRSQAKETISMLHTLGIKTCIISGDQEKPTRNLANQLGIDQYFAETLPEDKANIVARLQSEGRKVCFIGDGINDSVALQKADVSVSLHGAATIAQDVADIILINPSLLYLPHLIQMSGELHQRMSRGELLNNVAGVGCVSGVLIFGMGLGGAMLLYTGGALVNIANSMLPMFSRKNKL